MAASTVVSGGTGDGNLGVFIIVRTMAHAIVTS
jgi:hypothetical protein